MSAKYRPRNVKYKGSRAGHRDFWCRHHIWHSWESRRVALFKSREPVTQMWVCRRCKMGMTMTPMIPARGFARGGFITGDPLTIVGDSDGCYIPLPPKRKP